MKKALSVLAIFVVGFFILTGQKLDNNDPRWNVNPAMTRLTPVGQFVDLPSYPNTNNYVNPNTKTTYVYSPAGVMAVSPNFMIKTVAAPSTQSEIAITSSLLNPSLMFSSANYFNGSSVFSTPGYISTNGGLNFAGLDITNSNYGDPAPMIDKNNTFIISFITLAGSMGTAYSTNYGTSWSGVYTFPGASTSADKNLSGTNYAAASPYYGHSYTVYTEFAGTYTNRIVFTKTTNSGVSWSTIAPVSPPVDAGHHHQGCDVTAGPEGNVYAIWANCTTNGQNSTEDYLGFAKSTDGGTTWAVATNQAADMNGIRAASFGPWGIRVAGFPRLDVDRSGGPRNGWLYVVASEKNFSGGDASDVFMWTSSNQGTNWSAPIRVNQDAANGKLQYHAAVNVDAGGGVNVVYHDCRNSNTNDSVETYVNRSVDGGATWTEIKVSDAKFRPAPISGTATGYQGDYIGITSGNNRIIPNWADNRIGRYQSWAAIVDIGPSIAHTPLGNTEQISGTRTINCVITPAGSPITPSSVKLYYSLNNPTLTSNVTMTNSSGDNWTAALPLSGAGLYRYYITATDGLSRTATYPSGAPANTVQFTAAPDTVKPVITHTALGNQPKLNWPVTVTASATDNIGIDSVWVGWYKNNISTGYKKFKLLSTGGTNYAAAFNSINADVAVGDSIFYRVLARDNSSGHNADSTARYGFKIINEATITIGTGTTAGNFPFTTYWMDGRTQYLFLASEMNTATSLIKQIGFDVTTADPGPMNGYKVSFQNTSATTLTGYVTTGWTTAYAPASYTVPGTGWQMVTLTTPFQYNAGSNLLVEICYNNSAYTNYSVVNTTAAPNMFWGRYGDLSTGDGCATTTWSSTTAPVGRANTRMVLEPITGVNPIGSTVPQVYSLSQNYPNPFNPVTKINFALPKQGFVTMKIYDVLGREVRTLVNEVKSAGSYSVDFNASEFASGVYFYKLETEGFSDIKKMMLIK